MYNNLVSTAHVKAGPEGSAFPKAHFGSEVRMEPRGSAFPKIQPAASGPEGSAFLRAQPHAKAGPKAPLF